MKTLKFIFLMTFIASGLFSQEIDRRSYVKQDETITRLLQSHRQINQRQKQKGTDGFIDGFRVQIYTDSGNRSSLRTDRMKAEFDQKYPTIRSYKSYDEPYFKLRVGDFRTRLDAQRFLNEISSTYLFSIIVVDKINFPPLGISELSGSVE
jgi:hypothetical protein